MRRIHIFYLLFTLQHPRSWFAPAWIAGQHFLGRWRPSFFHTFAQLLLTVRCFHSQSLLSNVAFAIGCSYFANYEQTGAGAQWSNWATSPLDDDSYSLCGCIGMLLADSAIYLFLTWYIETVFPGSLNCSMRDFTIQFNFFCFQVNTAYRNCGIFLCNRHTGVLHVARSLQSANREPHQCIIWNLVCFLVSTRNVIYLLNFVSI